MEYLNLGKIKIEKYAALAPMASVADTAYRLTCKKYGASLLTSELISAKAISYGDRKSSELCRIDEKERPYGIQIFGSEPDIMKFAAKEIVNKYSPDFIDINMGCPVPKVVKGGAGSALMKTPELASNIVTNVVEAVDVPVTVKFRKGWDSTNINAVEFAKLMEKSGASLVTVHCRTKEQMYRNPVDIDIIRKVKENIAIPVIGNGGITNPIEAKEMYEKTGCDLVMIGQGTFGCPWIFEDIKNYFDKGILPIEKSTAEKIEVMLEHISLLVSLKGEENGMREARTQTAFYIKGMRGAAMFRNECGKLTTYSDLKLLADKILAENK